MTAQDVLEKHKEIFIGFFEGDKETTCMFWGLEVPEDWLPIVDELCSVWTHFGWRKRGPKPKLIADQVKEKHGGFRFYYHLEGAWDGEFDWYENQFDGMLAYAEYRITELEKEKILLEQTIDKEIEDAVNNLDKEPGEDFEQTA